MKNILKKTINLLIILIISFSFNNINAFADTYRIVSIFPDISNASNYPTLSKYKGVTYKRKSKKQYSDGHEDSGNQEVKFSGIGVYGIVDNGMYNKTYWNKYVTQVYCIEPGSGLVTNANTGHGDDSSYSIKNFSNYTSRQVKNNEEQMKKIKAIFTFSKKPVAGFYENNMTSFADSYLSTVYATQLLIWEIADGERTSFASEKPDNNISGSAYCHLFGCSGTTAVTATSTLKSEYKRIVNDINRIFGPYASSPNTKLGNYTLSTDESKANNYSMAYNSSTKKYSLTISDDYAKYYSVTSSDKNITIENKGTSIILSSSKPISNSVITFKVGGASAPAARNNTMNYLKDDGSIEYLMLANASDDLINNSNYKYTSDIVYKSDGSGSKYRQDLVKITPKTTTVYLKVTTPNYKLEVKKVGKKDEDDTEEENLSGVKFELYDSEKKIITDDLTTDNNGSVSYDKIKIPGTYYIKEIKTAPGYNLKDGKINNYKSSDFVPITISSSNNSTPALVTAYNYTNKFNLIKYSVDENGNKTKIEDNCEKSRAAEFEIRDSSGRLVCFKEVNEGRTGDYEYSYTAPSSDITTCTDAESSLYTCDGKFSVDLIPGCESGETVTNYTVSEKSFAGNQIDSEPNKTINVCGADRAISFYNGFSGIEFQKKNEDGKLLKGGSFKLQMKKNGVYIDVAVLEIDEGVYKYDESSNNYEINTLNGTALISDTPVGEYRMVEIVAPEGYDTIKPSDSKATVIISDKNKDGYYQMEMIDKKSNKSGSSDEAELIVTITTGRNVIPYGLVIGILIIGLITFIVIRNKNKK